MSIALFRWLAPAGLLFCAALAQAQTQTQTQTHPSAHRPDPNDPKVLIPVTPYQSSFQSYRKLREEPMLSWKESNDLVGQIGGWRVYAREAAESGAPAQAPSPTNSQPATPIPPGRGEAGAGHKGHK